MRKMLRILMLEDLEDDAWLIERALKKGDIHFSSLRVDSRNEFTEALDSFHPDLILSDHALPQFNSIEALEICHRKKLKVPFLLVTGAVSEEFAVSCLKKGAADYVLKSNLARLPLAIKHALRLRRHEDFKISRELILKNQNEELKKLNRELDLFVYSTSHNLRAPLRSVLGLVNLSRHELADNNTSVLPEYFTMMEQSIAQLDETLKLILEYSKSSRLDDESEVIDFDKLFDGIFTNLKFHNGPESILKITTVHPGPAFACNKMRLSLIVLNILSNAIKYYDPSKKQSFIKVEVFPTEEEAVIVIDDNGIGISDELQNRVFEMFYRATEKSDGSGLGLYIVKETVDRLGGAITLLSTPGAGTTFRITIPNLYVAS